MIFCIVVLISGTAVTAQDHHLPLMSQGPVPEHIYQLAIEKIVDSDMQGISRVEKKARGDFELGATFFLDYDL